VFISSGPCTRPAPGRPYFADPPSCRAVMVAACRPSCPFRRNGPNTICGSCGSCYADNLGRYSQALIKRAQWARFEWTRECLRSAEGTQVFVETMVEAIDASGYLYMRVRDSGDLFYAAYTRAWIRICQALSWVRFRFPTRRWQAPWVDTIKELAALPNVAVRPSAIHFDDEPPRVDGLAAGTTASTSEYTCPAPRQHNSCGECRRCWSQSAGQLATTRISYTAPRTRLNARHERAHVVAVIVSSR